MEDVIRVTGRANGFYKPDTFEITMNIRGVCADYGAALAEASRKTALLRDALEKVGFRKDDLKTRRLDINEKYEQYKENSGSTETWKKKFIGFCFNGVLLIQFPADKKKLGEVLDAIIGSEAEPEFHIGYTLKDKEKAKKELLVKAVNDAKEKAEILAEAAGVKLDGIRMIDYSFSNVTIREDRRFAIDAVRCSKMQIESMEFEPEDLEADDTVTVIFDIE